MPLSIATIVRLLPSFAVLAAHAAGVQAAPPEVPLAAFVNDTAFERPTLSPDGQLLAVVVSALEHENGARTLTIYKVPERTLVSRLRLAQFQVPIAHHWVSDKRLVVEVGSEYGRLEAPVSSGIIFATDVDGQNQKPLRQAARGTWAGRPEVPNGHFWLRRDHWDDHHWNSDVIDVDTVTEKQTVITSLPIGELRILLRRDGQPGFAFGADANNQPMLFRHEGNADVRVPLDVDEKDESVVPIAFSPDNLAIYGSLSVADGPSRLVRQLPDGRDRRVLAQDDVGSVDMIAWGQIPREPFAAATSVGVPSWRYFEPNAPDAVLHRSLSAQFPGAVVTFINFSIDGSRLLFAVNSDRDPGVFYLWDRATSTAHFLFGALPTLDATRMGERRAIALKARDGLELRGYLTLPAGLDAHHLPLVLVPHGGPHGIEDRWFFDDDAQFLASRGYAVLQVNYRGSAGRGMAFRKAGFGEWGGKIQDDLIDAVRWSIGEGVVDPSRVCVYGASFGAFAAMHVVAREPAMFKCAVGFAGLYDVPMWFKRYADDRQGHAALTQFVGDERKAQERISPTRFADRINVPVLLIHGERDYTTPLAQGETMLDALREAKKQVEWVAVPGEGHGFYARKNQEDLFRRLEAFLAKHLKPGP